MVGNGREEAGRDENELEGGEQDEKLTGKREKRTENDEKRLEDAGRGGRREQEDKTACNKDKERILESR
ncbi:hypothetical protein E2C01_085744 [Portunus trituberculatus]|uniref:Uncharacterized protein n=1 Tax=Portunus trituberculatus TaxID=210409 RepID=A0A5B7J9Q2_PORTR|nr:hypothetical protein [Portunus trituberculatus]